MTSISRRDIPGLGFAFALIAIIYRPLVFQGRVLASLDSEAYFYPNASYLAASLRVGRVPLWNPLIFAGVPFLANSQVGVLYPPNWLYLIGPVSFVANVLLVSHIALFSIGVYLLARISLQMGTFGATFAAITASCGGLIGGMVGHLNQVEALAWAPFSILLVEQAVVRSSFRLAACGSLTLALAILSGHTQVVYLTVSVAAACGFGRTFQQKFSIQAGSFLARRIALVICAPVLAILLTGVQILPTLELTRLSIRSAGLGFADAAAGSLPPPDVLISLLPTIGQAPSSTEWIGYVSVSSFLLALYGLVKRGRVEASWLVLISIVGLVLALGQFTPIYGIAYALVPGFRLFRVPARWISLWIFGVALLAGLGADLVTARSLGQSTDSAEPRIYRVVVERVRGVWPGWLIVSAGLVLTVVLVLFRYRLLVMWPSRDTILYWVGATTAFVAIARLSCRLVLLKRASLLALLVAELMPAASILPFNDAIWPDAIESPRGTVSDLLSTRTVDRILALGDNTYDPGDLGAIRANLDDTLPPSARDAYVTAVKHVEGMTPNILMRYGLPTIDGYDGGILPLARYHDFKGLFATEGPDVTDGRLRIQLRSVPSPSLLGWLNVRWLVMDRLRDRWVDGTYYDLGIARLLTSGATLALQAEQPFTTSRVGVFLRGASIHEPIGVLTVWIGDTSASLSTASPLGSHVSIDSAIDPNGLWFWTLPLPIAVQADSVKVAWQGEPGTYLRALSATDAFGGAGETLTVSPAMRLRFLGDMKMYENVTVLPRAFLARGLTISATSASAVRQLRDGSWDAKREAIGVAGEIDPTLAFQAEGENVSASIVVSQPERIVIRAFATDRRVLVLTDSYYPGWRATVDGNAATILPVNLMFRGIVLSAGAHVVEYTYQPESLYVGIAVSVVGLIALFLILILAGRRTIVVRSV